MKRQNLQRRNETMRVGIIKQVQDDVQASDTNIIIPVVPDEGDYVVCAAKEGEDRAEWRWFSTCETWLPLERDF